MFDSLRIRSPPRKTTKATPKNTRGVDGKTHTQNSAVANPKNTSYEYRYATGKHTDPNVGAHQRKTVYSSIEGACFQWNFLHIARCHGLIYCHKVKGVDFVLWKKPTQLCVPTAEITHDPCRMLSELISNKM